MTTDKLELADWTFTVFCTLFGDCIIVRASHLVVEANTVWGLRLVWMEVKSSITRTSCHWCWIASFISSEIFWWLLLDKWLSKLPASLLQHEPPICLTVSKSCWFKSDWWRKTASSVCSQLQTWLRPKHNLYSMATLLCWLVFILSSECLSLVMAASTVSKIVVATAEMENALNSSGS